MLPALNNAQLALPHSSIGIFPFLLLQDYLPRRLFNWQAPKPATIAREKLSLAEAIEYARKLQNGWNIARKIILSAQETKAKLAN